MQQSKIVHYHYSQIAVVGEGGSDPIGQDATLLDEFVSSK
jgi:hypothetical protein